MSAWDKTKHGGKAGFDKLWGWAEKAGAPINKLTNKIGSEAFWPQTLDKEADKAARILKSFCKDGFYTERSGTPAPTVDGPKQKPKVLVKIPQKAIQKCVGLAIFTVMRTGLWVSGAGGSGVLIARREDGSWSPPSGILVHTLGLGFMAGIDIYDCVIVINTREALNAFSKVRLSLGGEVSIVAGPVGAGGIIDGEVMKDRKPLWSYVKSRGLYAGLQIDGTIIVERNDENARFYGEKLAVGDILAGKVARIPPGTVKLMEVAKDAEGRTDVDQVVLQQVAEQPVPGDLEVECTTVPSPDQKTHFAPPPGQQDFYPPPPSYGSPGQQSYHPPAPSHDPQGMQDHYQPPSGHSQPGQQSYYPPPPNHSSSVQQDYNPSATNYSHPAQPDYYPPPSSHNPPERQDHVSATPNNVSQSGQQNYYPPPPSYPPPPGPQS